jgi:hypothetical protein
LHQCFILWSNKQCILVQTSNKHISISNIRLWLLLALMHPNWWCWNSLDNILLVGMKNRKDLLDEVMLWWVYLFEFTFVTIKKSTMLLLCYRIVECWKE